VACVCEHDDETVSCIKCGEFMVEMSEHSDPRVRNNLRAEKDVERCASNRFQSEPREVFMMGFMVLFSPSSRILRRSLEVCHGHFSVDCPFRFVNRSYLFRFHSIQICLGICSVS
jgi:hypothetical protein